MNPKKIENDHWRNAWVASASEKENENESWRRSWVASPSENEIEESRKGREGGGKSERIQNFAMIGGGKGGSQVRTKKYYSRRALMEDGKGE